MAKEIPKDPETWLALSLLWQRTFKPFIAVPLTELTVSGEYFHCVAEMVLLDELTLKSTTWGSLHKNRLFEYLKVREN